MKVGDVVQLKSGGPKMTVTCIDTPSHVKVAFFDTQGDYNDDCMLPVDALKVVRAAK